MRTTGGIYVSAASAEPHRFIHTEMMLEPTSARAIARAGLAAPGTRGGGGGEGGMGDNLQLKEMHARFKRLIRLEHQHRLTEARLLPLERSLQVHHSMRLGRHLSICARRVPHAVSSAQRRVH
jgi:hypothetical protein